MSQPYNTSNLTLFEALHDMYNPISGIPMTEKNKKFLISREWLTLKKKNHDVDYDS